MRKSFLNRESQVFCSSWSESREIVAVNRDFRLRTAFKRSTFLIRGWKVDAPPYFPRDADELRETFNI